MYLFSEASGEWTRDATPFLAQTAVLSRRRRRPHLASGLTEPQGVVYACSVSGICALFASTGASYSATGGTFGVGSERTAGGGIGGVSGFCADTVEDGAFFFGVLLFGRPVALLAIFCLAAACVLLANCPGDTFVLRVLSVFCALFASAGASAGASSSATGGAWHRGGLLHSSPNGARTSSFDESVTRTPDLIGISFIVVYFFCVVLRRPVRHSKAAHHAEAAERQELSREGGGAPQAASNGV